MMNDVDNDDMMYRHQGNDEYDNIEDAMDN